MEAALNSAFTVTQREELIKNDIKLAIVKYKKKIRTLDQTLKDMISPNKGQLDGHHDMTADVIKESNQEITGLFNSLAEGKYAAEFLTLSNEREAAFQGLEDKISALEAYILTLTPDSAPPHPPLVFPLAPLGAPLHAPLGDPLNVSQGSNVSSHHSQIHREYERDIIPTFSCNVKDHPHQKKEMMRGMLLPVG